MFHEGDCSLLEWLRMVQIRASAKRLLARHSYGIALSGLLVVCYGMIYITTPSLNQDMLPSEWAPE